MARGDAPPAKRFIAESAFIVVVALVAGVLRLPRLAIVAVMTVAWAVVAAVEITIQRRNRGRPNA